MRDYWQMLSSLMLYYSVSVVGFLDEGLLDPTSGVSALILPVSVVGFLDEGLLAPEKDGLSRRCQFQWLDF